MKKVEGLTLEQTEALYDIMVSEGWYAILSLLHQLHEGNVSRVMAYDLNQGPDQLVILKARAEGSLKLIKDLELFKKDRIRPPLVDKEKPRRSRRS